MMIDSTTKYFPINYWNKLGEQTLIEGNGTYYQNLSSFEDSVKQSGPMVNHKKEGVPLFVQSSLYPSGEGLVFGLAEASDQDIVLLDNGLDQGFRNGMICQVFRGEHLLGEIILVEVREDRSAGLITSLSGESPIRFNDLVKIKTVQF